MISSEILGAQLGARTKQTSRTHSGVSVMSGAAIIDGCVGGPICNGSSGGIYGTTLAAAEETSPVVTGLLFAGLAVGIFGIIKLYSSR